VKTTGFPTFATITEKGALPNGVTFTAVPGVTTTGTSTVGSTALTVTSGAGLQVGMAVSGPGIAAGSTIAAVSGTNVTLSKPAVSGAISNGTFTFGGSATFTGTPAALPSGVTSKAFPITLSATIGSGKPVTQSFTRTVSQPALKITSAATTTFQQGQNGTFTVTTTGFPTATLSIVGTNNLPSPVTFTPNGNGTATISGIAPSTAAGKKFTITIKATSGTASVTQVFTLAVVNYSTLSGGNFTVGKAGPATTIAASFPVPSVFPTGFTVTNVQLNGVSVAKLPAGLTVAGNANGTGIVINGTPAAGTGGIYSFQIKANGSPSAVSQVYTIVVNQPQPVITSTATAAFVVGQSRTFNVTTTGFPVAAIGIISGTLPAGVTLTDNGNGTATFSGAPAPGTGGTYTLVLSAGNGAGTATQTFTLTVTAPPVIISPNSTTFARGSLGSFVVTTIGLPAPTLTVNTVTGFPVGLGVVFLPKGNGIAVLQGTPLKSGTFTFLITATSGTQIVVQEFVLTVM
jgi:hypothetical protein